jgi:hypothetical protein
MYMTHPLAYSKRATNIILAGILALTAFVPVLVQSAASAYEQLNERSIAIATSEAGATNVVYRVSFKPATTSDLQAIIIDFCDGPIIATVCTTTSGTVGLDTNKDTIGIYNITGITGSWAVDASNSTATKLVLKNDTGVEIADGTTVAFDLGNGSTNNGINNPTGVNSFYARIITFAVADDADDYDSSSTGSNNPPTSAVDAGGIALSTVDRLTINARVQEVLQFCVGTDDGDTAANDCTDISGSTVDLGVIQAGNVSISPVSPTTGGNDKNGLAMIRTNAVNGAVIDYFAEPVSSDSGSVHMGSLRVPGAICTGTGLLIDGDLVDQCFNSAGTTRSIFTAAQEGFGMTVSDIDTSNGTTENLVRTANYAGDGTNDSGTGGFAWSQGTPDRIATSTGSTVKVLDDEMIILRFAAQASVTTPTGQYGVTSTYVATATF